MRELYFVSPYRRSIRTIHFQYGYAGKNDYAGKRFILKITSGEINGRGTSEGNTEEVVFEGEQELLKGVYERKRESREDLRRIVDRKGIPLDDLIEEMMEVYQKTQ